MQYITFDIGIRNMAYCVAVKNDEHTEIKTLRIVDLCCRKNDPQRIVDATLDMLQALMEDPECVNTSLPTQVFIESQMTATMKSIQTVINTFFKMMGKYEGLEISSKYLSPTHKLALMRDFPEYTELAPTGTSAYRKNKLDSIHFATWLLQNSLNDSKTLEIITSARKKDDLCDALLMAIYAMKHF
jgi:hypothetical protein